MANSLQSLSSEPNNDLLVFNFPLGVAWFVFNLPPEHATYRKLITRWRHQMLPLCTCKLFTRWRHAWWWSKHNTSSCFSMIIYVYFRLEVHMTSQYNTIQYNTVQCNTIQYNTMQCNATQRNATQRNATQRNATQRNATQYNTIQYNTIQYNTWQLFEKKIIIKIKLGTILTNAIQTATYLQWLCTSRAWHS